MTFPVQASNTLDLFLTSQPSFLKRCKLTPGFENHNSTILSGIQHHQQLPKPIQQKIYNWNKADIGQFTLIWVGFLGVCFKLGRGGGGVKLIPV